MYIAYTLYIYHNFIDTLLDNTISSQPVTQPHDKYVACVLYERQSENEWLIHFIVGKNFSHLLEVSK